MISSNSTFCPLTRNSFLALLIGPLFSCASFRADAPDIPNVVSDDEYSVYSAWLAHHFKEQPPQLLLSDLTFIFDPLGDKGCGAQSLKTEGHVGSSLLQALHRLGEAEYPVQTGKFYLPQFKLPWKFEEAGQSAFRPKPYRLISFSRVAFSADKLEAFFAVNDSPSGLCGAGGPLLATRRRGHWEFHSTGCYWVS